MSIRPVLYLIGLFLIALSIIMLIPICYNFIIGNINQEHFYTSAGITFITGFILYVVFYCKKINFKIKDIFLLTNLTWISLNIFSALPLYFVLNISYTDAFFESMSGITTTGSTILTNLHNIHPCILLWRSLLQWIGGIGFIVIAIAVLPFLQVGGMKLFHTESSDTSNKVMPHSGSIAKYTVSIYIVLTMLCALLYFFSEMSFFDAINHAMATISTGGFSTSDQSMSKFSMSLTYWTSIFFMFLASLPFILYIKLLKINSILDNTQVKTFIFLVLFIWSTFSIWLYFNSDLNFFQALTLTAFNSLSLISTTGFVLHDYSLWGNFAIICFFFLTCIGGCSGSTTGGLKIFRLDIMIKLAKNQLKQAMHPKAVLTQNYNGQIISNEIVVSLISFCFFFSSLVCIISISLGLLGLDFITSISAAVTSVANVGPGFGLVGPSSTFKTLPDTAKWILSFGMLIGRLEVITVLILLSPSFWKD